MSETKIEVTVSDYMKLQRRLGLLEGALYGAAMTLKSASNAVTESDLAADLSAVAERLEHIAEEPQP